jgi:hypothetical protein
MNNEPTVTIAAPPTASAQATPMGSPTQVPLPIGRRERQHGNLRTIADIRITSVLEAVDDLAIADRVAYVIARRTDATCLVIATAETFVIALCDTDLTADDAAGTTSTHPTDRIVTIATPHGMVPLLTPYPEAPR